MDEPAGPRHGGRALALLAAAALVVAGSAVAVTALDGTSSDTPTRTKTSSKSKSTSKSTTTSTDPPTTTEAPAPAQPTPEPSKSRADLIAQNNASFAATDADPAGQVAPLREAVDGLCVDESDINCAYALFNLGRALRLSGQPAEAIPLLERRLRISNDRVGAVQAELATAQEAAGVAPASGGNGKGPKQKKAKKGEDD